MSLWGDNCCKVSLKFSAKPYWMLWELKPADSDSQCQRLSVSWLAFGPTASPAVRAQIRRTRLTSTARSGGSDPSVAAGCILLTMHYSVFETICHMSIYCLTWLTNTNTYSVGFSFHSINVSIHSATHDQSQLTRKHLFLEHYCSLLLLIMFCSSATPYSAVGCSGWEHLKCQCRWWVVRHNEHTVVFIFHCGYWTTVKVVIVSDK